MSQEQTWENESWLSSARHLTHWISSTDSQSKVFLLVRHSQREEITDHALHRSSELTPLGGAMSREFGRHIPHDRLNRVFFSFISRCNQTAEEIVKGLSQNHAQVKEFDVIEELVHPEIRDRTVWDELHPDGENITDFVNHWAEGDFGENIEPFEGYSKRLKEELIERLWQDKDRSLHIHITHDLALMAAKRIFLRKPLKRDDREPFLGGIGYQFLNGDHTLFIGRDNKEHSIGM